MISHFIARIVNWNKARYNQEHISDLTFKLISEELDEFVNSTEEVDELDALIDIVYIAIGAMWKMGLSTGQIFDAIHIVCDSNDSKSVAKTSAHIKANIDKGPNFVKPESRLQELLDERS